MSFLAENDSGITDVDGDHSDWIELYNPNPFAIDLQGYGLKNGPTPATANRWDFPAGSTIPASGFRVVFASQKNLVNPANALHTDFSLDTAGEYLAFVRLSDNATLTRVSRRFPPQYADASYGYWNTPASTWLLRQTLRFSHAWRCEQHRCHRIPRANR
jgi:hypothetical protein